MVTQLGLCVVTPVFLCIFIGYQVDSRFGGKIMIPMVILGVLAGGRCAWMMAKKTLEQEKKEDERLRRERDLSAARTGISKPKQSSRIFAEGRTEEPKNREKEAGGL